MYIPNQDYFTIGASYHFDNVSFKLEHMCQHPVDSINGLHGGYNKVQITIGKEK